jgi:hypothetical protein
MYGIWIAVFLGLVLLLAYGALAVLQDFHRRVPEESPLIPGFDRSRGIGMSNSEFDGDTWNILPLALAEAPVDWMEAVDDAHVIYTEDPIARRSFSRTDSRAESNRSKLNMGLHR